MYTIEKRQLDVNVANDKNGIIEICPEGVVSHGGLRMMIIPHKKTYIGHELYFLSKEQAEHVATNFFKSTKDKESIAVAERMGEFIRFTMTNDNLAIHKIITCTEQNVKGKPW